MLADLGTSVLIAYGAWIAFCVFALLLAFLISLPGLFGSVIDMSVRAFSYVFMPGASEDALDSWALGIFCISLGIGGMLLMYWLALLIRPILL